MFKALDRYRAGLPEAQQYVAIKILHAAAANREERLASLRSEFYRTQALSHRNIVNVFELDRDGDMDFFTMELLEGELLSTMMRRTLPMPRLQAWKIIREIGFGLECAHAHNIVHADLKPNNIMITDSGEVRILDFGAEGPRSPKNAFSSLTPAYASCELLEGRRPDPRDDIYALSCLSYELLAGTHPFQRRRSTEARDFGIVPNRPSGLSRQQWQALTMGLSWHRARRSNSVRAWLDKLDTRRAGGPLLPAHDLESLPINRSLASSFRAAALLGVLVVCVAAWVSIAGLVGRKISSDGLIAAAAAGVQPNPGAVSTRETAVLPASAAQVSPPQTSEMQPQVVNNISPGINQPKPLTALIKSSVVSASDHTVRSGERFAEIRVHRSSGVDSDTPFVWWTEAASARPGVDYVQQGKAIQSFPRGKTSTSFFVKLVPTASRTQPEVFYIAIAAAGHGATAGKVARAAVWLPTNPDQS